MFRLDSEFALSNSKKIFMKWIEEIMCDTVALMTVGPAYLYAFILSVTQDNCYSFSMSYPPSFIRVKFMEDVLRRTLCLRNISTYYRKIGNLSYDKSIKKNEWILIQTLSDMLKARQEQLLNFLFDNLIKDPYNEEKHKKVHLLSNAIFRKYDKKDMPLLDSIFSLKTKEYNRTLIELINAYYIAELKAVVEEESYETPRNKLRDRTLL